jgi:hypothetical protein
MAWTAGQRAGMGLMHWLGIGFSVVVALTWGLDLWGATVSTHSFGRYEMLIQEGTTVAIGEILGTVRRQTGRPEYALTLGAQKRVLELNILGPGNRPYRLAATEFLWPAVSGAGSARFIVESSVVEGDLLTIQFRHASQPVQTRLVVNLRQLERMLEGEH